VWLAGPSLFDAHSAARSGPGRWSGWPRSEVILFHHAQGLTPGVISFADELRRAGHIVRTPDLYEGRTFDTLAEEIGHAEQIGFGEVIERGVRAVEGLPTELVYAGFSLGVLPAQKLAQTRPSARGALLFYSCVPVVEFGSAWPDGVPVQIHGMDADPIFVGEGDIDAARALVESTGRAELFLYPGSQHYFADSSLLSYDCGSQNRRRGPSTYSCTHLSTNYGAYRNEQYGHPIDGHRKRVYGWRRGGAP
jgi:dienelactone hydrolase